jgi:hypothetical protein
MNSMDPPYVSLDDIESFLSSEEDDKPQTSPQSSGGGDTATRLAPASTVPAQTVVKSEVPSQKRAPFCMLNATTGSATSTLSRLNVLQPRLAAAPVNNLFGLKPAATAAPNNVAVVPPICCGQPTATTTHTATSTYIKTEPVDTYEMASTGHQSCLHKMLSQSPERTFTTLTTQCSSPPDQRLVMPVVGQTRPPPSLVKSESVEEKWKEIEKFIHNPDGPSASRKRKRYGKLIFFFFFSSGFAPVSVSVLG